VTRIRDGASADAQADFSDVDESTPKGQLALCKAVRAICFPSLDDALDMRL
jgi:hypothetical protein